VAWDGGGKTPGATPYAMSLGTPRLLTRISLAGRAWSFGGAWRIAFREPAANRSLPAPPPG